MPFFVSDPNIFPDGRFGSSSSSQTPHGRRTIFRGSGSAMITRRARSIEQGTIKHKNGHNRIIYHGSLDGLLPKRPTVQRYWCLIIRRVHVTRRRQALLINRSLSSKSSTRRTAKMTKLIRSSNTQPKEGAGLQTRLVGPRAIWPVLPGASDLRSWSSFDLRNDEHCPCPCDFCDFSRSTEPHKAACFLSPV